MNKILMALMIVLSSLSFAESVDGVITPNAKKEKKKKYSTLVCDVRNKAVQEGEPSQVKIQAKESGEAIVTIKEVTDIDKQVKDHSYISHTINMTIDDLPSGFVNNKLISFKKVKPNKAFASNDKYLVYLQKSFPASIKVTVVNKETGVMKALPKCYVVEKFLTKIIKL